ncbi:CusA/CzcA family heavy metal efflux RND transporter [Microvirga sp. STS02]|uniref:CusA/CzcA family heavy metal efflux RND transporter n=1 Tax=Hymenobacter negativus TaxID=2795026 RepID=UPI0018DE0716|nr:MULTISPECIES: CusA/CzcA family heavy metal efflux RND transporter [Bacteria]MBH8567742.1 CusA/CzcA family heavy metal efflux RND transporter [Hymenobacter negativus]MBR7207476.1 CusA/CzcA family heavy metal efflux RND transporter [Microvirga sp. STS02]
MISAIINFSIRNKLLVGLMLAGLIAWGGFSAASLPLDAIPDVTNNQVQVITQSPALAAQEVEQLITVPLELQLRTIPGVTEIRSISRFGLSVITVVFEEDVDTYHTRQLVAEKLKVAEADLGQGLGAPGMAPITTGLGEIYQYTIKVKKGYEKQYGLAQLREVQDWLVKRRLAGVEGVVDVSSFGGYVREYEVSVDPARLAGAGVSMAELYEALQANNGNAGGSYLERGPRAFFIRGEGRATSLQDIGNIVVKPVGTPGRGGAPLLVRDVAAVRFGHAVRYGAMNRDGQGETVGGVVLMLKGASSEATIKNVKARVAEIQQTLPKGLEIDPFLDRTKLVDKAIHTVVKNLIEGGVIVVVVLLLLLGNLRAGLVVAGMIPLCMLFALGMMRTFGVSANLMSLGALDFGLIVDGAVIIVEAVIAHLLHERLKAAHETMDDITEDVTNRLMKSALFGQLIILIVYLPILSLTGVEGKMFRPMALTVSFAILGAMIMCLTYVPAVTAWALKKNISEKPNLADRIVGFLHKLYDLIIRAALGARWLVVGVAVGLLALGGLVFTRLGGEFIPQLDEGDFAMNVTLAPGSSLDESILLTSRIQRILKSKFPEVLQVVGKIGTSEIPTDPMSLEDSDQMIILKDHAEWTSAHTREELANKMQAALAGVPGVSLEFQQPIQMRFNELISGVKSDVSVKIYGDDLDVLRAKADEAAALIRPLQGVGDIKVEQIIGLPQLRVSYDRARLAQYGLRVIDLNTLLQSAFAGQTTGQVYEGERRFDLVLRLDSLHRRGPDDLNQLLVSLPDGKQIPLSEVATVALKPAPAQISRDDARRRVNIGVNVRGRDVQSLVQDIQGKLKTGLRLPAGYSITYGGQFENLNHAKARLAIAVPVSLVLIFMLLFLAFRSVKEALLIFTGIPLAAIGGVLALGIRGMPFSISAGVGFIALFGVAVLNGIVLVASLNELATAGVRKIRERVLRATEERFRPVLLTASVASLGFLPMALSGSAGAEVQKPLATVVIGGLITATLLTLVVLPVLYTFFVDDDEPSPEVAAEEAEEAKRREETGEAPAAEDDEAKPASASFTGLAYWLERCRDAIFCVSSAAPSGSRSDDFVQRRDAKHCVSTPLRLLLLAAALLPATARAQKAPTNSQLSLAQALSTGLAQSPLVQAATLQAQQQQALTRTGYDLPRLVFDYQYGQISGPLADHSFNVLQQSAFPTVYGAQRKVLQTTAEAGTIRARAQRRELARSIRSGYYNLLVTYRLVALLRKQDSLYQRAARAARIRYQVGETNRLEQVSAEARARELQNRLATLRSELLVQRQQLGLLLGQPNLASIDTTASPRASLLPADTAGLTPATNPTLALYQQQLALSQQQTKLEKLRRLPDLRAGYFNQTINQEKGFNVAQAGIAVPLLGGAQRARIAAAKIGEEAAQVQLNYANTQFGTQLSTLRQQLARAQASLLYYENYALPQARLILDTAEKSRRAGDIEYVEYVVNTQPAWQIQEACLEQLRQYNELVANVLALVGVDAP